MKKLFLVMIVILLSIPTVFTQSDSVVETEKTNFIVFQTDYVTRFIWRGQNLSDMPNLQPALLYTTPKFDVGFLGSTSLSYDGVGGNNWNEFDVFAEYRPIPFIGVRLTDFYFQNLYLSVDSIDVNSKKYFDYGKNTTGHYLVADVLLYFGAKTDVSGIPYKTLTVDASVIIYGNDKKGYYNPECYSEEFFEQAYSTYIDITYNWKNTIRLFAGFTPKTGFYNNQYTYQYSENAAIVNFGARYDVTIPITEKFGLPIYATLITNPNQQKVYFVAGLTLLSIK